MKIKAAKIFRWIWRTNGVLILLVGLGFCGLAATIAGAAFWERLRSSNYDTVQVASEPSQTRRVSYDYGNFTRIEGTNFAMSLISSEQRTYSSFLESGGSSIKTNYSTATRNIVFLNLVDQSTTFLLPDNSSLILSTARIAGQEKVEVSRDADVHPAGIANASFTTQNQSATTGSYNRLKTPIICISYQIVLGDTNNDGRLTSEDNKTIAFSDASGSNFTQVISDISETLGEERISDKLMMYFYRSNGKSFVAQVDLLERKIISTKELPVI